MADLDLIEPDIWLDASSQAKHESFSRIDSLDVATRY